MKRETILSLFIFVIISLLAYFVLAGQDTVNILSPVAGGNLSGSTNLTTNTTLSLSTNTIHVNFTFTNSVSGAKYLVNITNTTVNQSYFHTTFDTTLISEGIYNLYANATNSTGYVANSTVLTVNVDNTAPNVTLLNPTSTVTKSSGLQAFNVSLKDYNPGNTSIKTALLEFNNNGTHFNKTLTNVSGNWNANVNISTLTEATHTVTVYVQDYAGNINQSGSFTVIVDRTAPTVSLAKSSSTSSKLVITITTSSDVTSSCSSTTGTVEGTGITQTLTSTGLSGGKSYSFTVTCTDPRGLSGSTTESFTTDAAGSGPSGSGGGVSSSVPGQFSKKVWSSIFKGETASVEVKKGDLGVTDVSFSVTKDVYGAWISVDKKDNFPSSVSKFAGKQYQKLEISKGPALKEGTFENAMVKFKVLKTWLADNELEKGSVALFHYADNKWTALSTSIGEDDGTYVHYSAETPGFSYFLIGGKEGAQVAQPETQQAPATEPAATTPAPTTEPAPAPAPQGTGSSLPWVLVALVVIGVAVALYLMNRR